MYEAFQIECFDNSKQFRRERSRWNRATVKLNSEALVEHVIAAQMCVIGQLKMSAAFASSGKCAQTAQFHVLLKEPGSNAEADSGTKNLSSSGTQLNVRWSCSTSDHKNTMCSQQSRPSSWTVFVVWERSTFSTVSVRQLSTRIH